MKKTLILAIILLLITINTKAQEVIDTTVLRCKYTFTNITNTEKNTGYNELMTLDIGKNICKYYSEKQKLFDSIIKEQIITALQTMKRPQIALTPSVRASRVATITYFNYPAGKITVSERIREIYEYTENIENVNWQFYQNENKEILGYNCKKATGKFRGRDYEVWYAPDIPINKGPYKFSGLPGLILSITDNQEQIKFVCESVEKISVPIFKDEYDGRIAILSREKYLSIEKKFHEDPMSIMGEFTVGTGTDANGNPLPPPKSMPYNPIELE
jgi:GLPGLI family protein